jgi:hypothetical protein
MGIILLELYPIDCKVDIFKLILNSKDLLIYFNYQLEKMIDDENGLIKMLHQICGELILEKSLLYSKFVIPMEQVKNCNRNDYQVMLQNKFDTRS